MEPRSQLALLGACALWLASAGAGWAEPPAEPPAGGLRREVVRAQQLVRAGHLREAEAQLSAATGRYPESPHLWSLLAQVRFGERRYERAIAAFERALALLPDEAKLYNGLGASYFELQRYDEATHAFESSLALDPGAGRPHLFLGRIAFERGDHAAAERHLRAAAERSPEEPLAHYHLGLFLVDRGRLEEAAQAFEACLARSPDLPGAHLNLGNVYRRLGEREAARRHLARFQQLSRVINADTRKRARLSHLLGAARADLEGGRLDAALALVLEAREIAPEEPAVHAYLATLYERQGRAAESERARAEFERLSGEHP